MPKPAGKVHSLHPCGLCAARLTQRITPYHPTACMYQPGILCIFLAVLQGGFCFTLKP
nr:MAG TPA: hypothetical protein [Caudoviricetes sp.]